MTSSIQKISLASILMVLYVAFILLMISSYKIHNITAKWNHPYEAIAELGFFLVTLIHFKGLERWAYCLFAVLFFSVSAALIHFYFSENYNNVDWQGISGAMNVVTVQAIFSTYILIFAAACIGIVKFVIKKISTSVDRI